MDESAYSTMLKYVENTEYTEHLRQYDTVVALAIALNPRHLGPGHLGTWTSRDLDISVPGHLGTDLDISVLTWTSQYSVLDISVLTWTSRYSVLDSSGLG
jgi:hypothetical protein